MLSIGSLAVNGSGSTYNLGNIGGGNGTTNGVDSDGFINDIRNVSVSQFIDIIGKIADMRAENGAEQNRVMQRIDAADLYHQSRVRMERLWMQTSLWNPSFARKTFSGWRSSASMTAQANQLSRTPYR